MFVRQRMRALEPGAPMGVAGGAVDHVEQAVLEMIARHRAELACRIHERREAMKADANYHHLICQALGISADEAQQIDLHQNVARLLYRRAGTLAEQATQHLINSSRNGRPARIQNTTGTHPTTFQIDCLVPADRRAHEVKWCDATTDGDHRRKENDKVTAIVHHGLTPVRVMLFLPQRAQARRIQEAVSELYRQHGEAHVGDDAWAYLKRYTGYDLHDLLKREASRGQTSLN